MEAASCSNNLYDSLLFEYAFIFAQALKSELYFEDSLKLLDIENKKYPIIAKRTMVMFFSKNLFITVAYFGHVVKINKLKLSLG